MGHYDVFSNFYEYGTEKLHGRHRIAALDLPTGTGANLPLLEERIGPTGSIYAIDASPGMLARARTKVDEAGWQNVTLIEADARTLDAAMIGVDQVDAAICMLGLSVVP